MMRPFPQGQALQGNVRTACLKPFHPRPHSQHECVFVLQGSQTVRGCSDNSVESLS